MFYQSKTIKTVSTSQNINTNILLNQTNDNEENIVSKIFYYFKNEMNLKKNYKINIEKNIPNGAGLGGGSSNAGVFIKFLLEELKIKQNSKSLYEFEEIDKYDKYEDKYGERVVIVGENGFCMYEYLRQSQIYSIIQYIAKLSYKWLLFSRDDDKRKAYEEKIRSKIAVYFEISNKIKKEKIKKERIKNYWKEKYENENFKGFISQGEDGDLGE